MGLKRMSLMVDEETYELLRRASFEQRTSMSKLVDAAIRAHVSAASKRPARPRRRK